MALPIIQQPVYEVFLQSLNKSVKFRPFLVKEEKILLMAIESEETEPLVNAIKQIITNCLLDDIDVNALPMFDVQMLFLNIRMKSVSETISLTFKCEKLMPDSEEVCNMINEYDLSLGKIVYELDSAHTNNIMLSDDVGVRLKYPTLTNLDMLLNLRVDDSIKLVARYVDYIFDNDQTYTRDQFTDENLEEFLSNLSNDQFKTVLKFFETAPKVVIKDTVQCVKCGSNHEIYSEDLYRFFL